jgi:hypothetical protein
MNTAKHESGVSRALYPHELPYREVNGVREYRASHVFADERDAKIMRNAVNSRDSKMRARRIWLASFGMTGTERTAFWLQLSPTQGAK